MSIINAGQPITDLVVDTRVATITRYAASNTVQLVSTSSTDFISSTTDNFVVEIDPLAAEPNTTNSTTIHLNPITQTDLDDANVCTVLKYLYYDNYGFTGVENFNTSFHNTLAYSINGTTISAIAKSNRTIGFATGSRTRVLNTNTFINNTSYYNDDGQTIQIIETNIKQGKDITTLQYHFNGIVLSTSNIHTALGTSYSNFETITKNVLDNIGRTTAVFKNLEIMLLFRQPVLNLRISAD